MSTSIDTRQSLKRPCYEPPTPKLQALLDRLSVFIEDYITKATSLAPTRAYSFLLSLSPGHSRPYLKSRVLGETTFVDHDKTLFWRLSLPEREGLDAAFLKYKIMCQVLRPRLQNLEQASHQCEEIFKEAINRLHPREIEGILCVHE